LNSTKKNFKGAAEVIERRQNERHTFSATAEVVEMSSGIRLSTRAADLSQKGCYLDSLNPFAVGAKVRLYIQSDKAELTCAAMVRDSQPGMGMGIAFMDLDDAQKALIEGWLERLVSPTPVDLSPSLSLETAKATLPSDQAGDLAERLVELLHKKGLLSSGEVAALLRARIL